MYILSLFAYIEYFNGCAHNDKMQDHGKKADSAEGRLD
jgi:hypothetical protein